MTFALECRLGLSRIYCQSVGCTGSCSLFPRYHEVPADSFVSSLSMSPCDLVSGLWRGQGLRGSQIW